MGTLADFMPYSAAGGQNRAKVLGTKMEILKKLSNL